MEYSESYYIGVLIGSLIMGFIGLAIAKSKGNNAGGGFALGFFLGLIGVIIEACIGSKNKKQNNNEKSVKCSACGNLIPADADFCPNCGVSFKD